MITEYQRTSKKPVPCSLGNVEGGFKNGATLCRGPGGRAPLLGTLGYERKALGMGISLQRAWGEGSFTGDSGL